MKITEIINNRFEQAKLGLLLLKELNEPGNVFFYRPCLLFDER